MVIDHVHDHSDAVAVAGADKVFELVAPAASVLDREIVRVAVAPAHPTFVFGEGHQLDRVDAEFLQVGQQVDGVLQGSARAAPGAQAVDMQLVDDEVLEPSWYRPLWIELIAREIFLGHPASFGKLRRAERGRHSSGSMITEQLLVPSRSCRRPLHPRREPDQCRRSRSGNANRGRCDRRPPVVLGDAEHVEGVVAWPEVGEIGRVSEVGVPHAVLIAMHWDHGADAAPVVPDIPTRAVVLARKLAPHELDVPRIRRPYGEAQRGRSPTRREQLIGAKPPAVGEVVALGRSACASVKTR